MLFTNVQLILPDRVTPAGAGAWLRVEGGHIAEVSPEGGASLPSPRAGETVVDGGGRALLAPGFIDLHVHGALGRDTMEASADAWRAITRFHAVEGGTTALALTTVAAPRVALRAVLDAAHCWQENGDGARLLGIHLEGPCFAPAKAGAHRAECVRDFDREEWRELLGSGPVTQATFAPERPGAGELLGALLAAGVLPSAGHSDAWDEEVQAAFARGLRHVTHLFNAMSGARRRGPRRVAGLLECALAEPAVVCELIADGCHVSPTLLRLAYHAKGPDGLVLVTDATAGAGLPEGARYNLGGLECEVRDGVGVTENAAGATALAGSTATMLRCVRNMVKLAGVPVSEAVRMATRNPARAVGQLNQRGALAPGSVADLVLLPPALDRVLATFIGGQRVV